MTTDPRETTIRAALIRLMNDSGHEHFCQMHMADHGYKPQCSCGWPEAIEAAKSALALLPVWPAGSGAAQEPQRRPFLCPKCNGQKFVWMPPDIPGDQPHYSASTLLTYACTVCNATGIVFDGPLAPDPRALAALRELQAAQHHARRAQDDAEERMATDAADQAFVTGQAYRAAIDILAKHFGLETPPITGTVQETHL